MAQLVHAGFWTPGEVSLSAAITDLQAFEVNQRLFLVSTSGAYGALTSWEWTASGLVQRDSHALSGTAALPAPGGLAVFEAAGLGAFYSFGGAGTGLEGYQLTTTGEIQSLGEQGAGALTLETVIEVPGVAGPLVFGAARNVDGLTYWNGGAAGLSAATALPSGIPGSGTEVPDMAVLEVGGSGYLLTLDPTGDAVHAFRLDLGGPVLTDTASPANQLWVNTPMAVESVTLAGVPYAIVAGAGSNSLSVLQLNAQGDFTVTDHVIDDLTTRFDAATVLETISVGERAFVLASGADDGVSLMALMPGGRLLGLAHLASAYGASLEDITALEAVVVQDGLRVFAGGEGIGGNHGPEGEWIAGVAAVDVVLGELAPVIHGTSARDQIYGDGRADMIFAGAENDAVWGEGGDDIIDGGLGADTLWGGTGSDIFIFTPDGERDRIQDFELGVDRIDLSALGMARSIGAISIQERANGARLNFMGETLDIVTHDSSPLTELDFTLEMLFDLSHTPLGPLPDAPMFLTGTTAGDLLTGGALADTLHGAGGADLLVGDGGDDLMLAEEVRGAFDLAASEVVRLYQATLDRLPDESGFRAFTNYILSGAGTAEQAAASFVASAEFQNRYGATTNSEFVTLLYNNVLERAPDAGGLQAWVNALNAGMSRAEAVWGFGDSNEFQRNMLPATLDYSFAGLQAGWADDVYRLFRATLDREPAEAGLLSWAQHLAEGVPYLDVVAGFVGAAEFRTRYGENTTNSEFVTLLYNNVLERAPDAGGLQAWVNALNTGMSREEVVSHFAASPEFVSNTRFELRSYMQGLGADDTLRGGAGADVLFGGIGADTFIFNATDAGEDRVVGLEDWDRVLVEQSSFADAGALFAALTQEGADVALALDVGRVIFSDTDLADLTADMFDLG